MNVPLTIAAAALLCGTAAAAQTPPTKPAPMAAAKPAPKPRAKAAAPSGRMVPAKLANGKTVTYNCSLAGNKTKKACQ